SSSNKLHAFDVEIYRTLHRLRKVRSTKVCDNSSFISVSDSINNTFTSNPTSNSNFFEFSSGDTNSNSIANNTSHSPDKMENNDRTLKELATPDLEQAKSYKLKSRLIHLLPKFHGLASEDPHKDLKEFHMVCSTMRPHGILEDYIKIKAFPFSLDGAAKDWMYLQPILFNTWGDMKQMFLEKFFLASRTATIRKEIYGIRQNSGETLHEYWERFNKLCATCLHHQINDQLLIQYFYKGLMKMDQNMIDATSGGVLMDKTPVVVRNLISNMASNTLQFRTRGAIMSKVVNEVGAIDNLSMGGSSTDRVKGSIQPKDLDLFKACLKTKIAINNRFQNTKSHHSDNNNNNSGRELPQTPSYPNSRSKEIETNEELLKMFRRVEINIPLLDAIKKISKYAKFPKELCMHKRKKMKGGVEMGGVMSALIKNEEVVVTQQAMPKKSQDPKTFSVPCIISNCTFADSMLDLGASINVMSSSIYNSLNFGDLEPSNIVIQLANKSIVHPLGIFEDVLVQVNELFF
ncbi:hypothetical protein CR513_58431, partial [Mucuna pruriens]